jgi:hypothetical protein
MAAHLTIMLPWLAGGLAASGALLAAISPQGNRGETVIITAAGLMLYGITYFLSA